MTPFLLHERLPGGPTAAAQGRLIALNIVALNHNINSIGIFIPTVKGESGEILRLLSGGIGNFGTSFVTGRTARGRPWFSSPSLIGVIRLEAPLHRHQRSIKRIPFASGLFSRPTFPWRRPPWRRRLPPAPRPPVPGCTAVPGRRRCPALPGGGGSP